MFGRRGDKNKLNKIDQKTDFTELKLNQSLENNIKLIQNIFSEDDTLIVRYFENQMNTRIKCSIFFIDGMVNVEMINENVVEPFVQNTMLKYYDDTIINVQNQVIVSNDITKTADVSKLVKAIISGDTVLFIDGSSEGLIVSTKGWQSRTIEEPDTEKVTRGPREGFTEPLMVNLSLIRRKLETTDLKFKLKTIGTKSQTKVCICYLKGIANQKILNELIKRLDSIDIDGILASGYISELIEDASFSPFKTIGSTERPDIVAAKLLEGRIAVVVDGTPVVLTLPHLFVEYFQANEDYYINYYFSSINRILRILGFILTVTVPAIYLALVTFHHEMIPTPLLISISSARQGVPFPTIVETIVLLFIFEILRETGIRMPANIGQALSIVGALVLGQASVEAKLVSAPIVIIVAISGITSLMIPKIQGAAIIMRITFLLLSAFLGLYGLIFGIIGVLLHLCELRSFGVPYMLYLTSLDPRDLKDTAIRAPLWSKKFRPRLIVSNNRVRQAINGKKT